MARKHCPSLKTKRISPHVLRHSAAMDLLQHGIDCTMIALARPRVPKITQIYLHAVAPNRYRPDDQLMAFLESL